MVRDRSAAEQYVDEIRQASARLIDFPDLGRRYNDRYRVLVVRNHLIFYWHEINQAEVVIVTILDGRRDVEALLQK